jgi:hypothetical protein
MVERINNGDVVAPNDKAITALVDTLTSADGVERQAAREQLDEYARWEAAKALGAIADPSAAPALVNTLEDTKAAVRWLAATALIHLGCDALVPLLRRLEGNSDSIWFRDGAHHVLSSLIRDGVADEAIPVVEALENIEPSIEAPIAAYHVLQDLRGREETSV